MKIIREKSYHTQGAVLVLGMFDGLHLGHQVLLEKGKVLSQRSDHPLIVCTFDRHPLSLIAPEHAPKALTTLEERIALLEQMQVDALLIQEFTRETMNTLPEEYIARLVQRFRPSDVVCGYNFTFGKNGAGTPALLTALGTALDFRTWVVPKITLEGMEVSSTAIRNELARGNVALVARMLKRPYAVTAQMEKGRLLLGGENKQLPAPGSYRVLINGSPALLTLDPEGGAKAAWKPRSEKSEIRFLASGHLQTKNE